MLSINHNLAAASVANALTFHYGNLQTSTQRLSSGLRINGAADDAAGLAIRELMRADIAALHQGMRNVNDGISMLQTMDGALGVIDEKLIRMKELAEQAATGTYDSTQRLMIDSEFQAMGAEINRIARATDFNGIKLLDGKDVTGINGIATYKEVIDGDKKFDVTGGAGLTVCAQPNATVSGGNTWNLDGIKKPGALGEGDFEITITNEGTIKFGDQYLLVTPLGMPSVPAGTTLTLEYDPTKYSGPGQGWDIKVPGKTVAITSGSANMCLFGIFDGTGNLEGNYLINVNNLANPNNNNLQGPTGPTTWTAPANDRSFNSSMGTVTANMNGNILEITVNLDNVNTISNSWTIAGGNGLAVSEASVKFNIKDITEVSPITPQPTGPTDPDNPLAPNYKIPDDVIRIHFGPGADMKEDFYDIKKHDATLAGLGLEGVDIQTQDNAQNALVQINDAIVVKDGIRAEYGAMQNRLENTYTNLSIQAENLQASESRISDAEIAQEMMNFVRQQILTQSAVAMLAQANSMPQMVMSLIR